MCQDTFIKGIETFEIYLGFTRIIGDSNNAIEIKLQSQVQECEFEQKQVTECFKGSNEREQIQQDFDLMKYSFVIQISNRPS